MEWTGLNELREKYLSFFESKGHLRLKSFPLIPQGDKSLLLINSGMAPMKKYFTGEVTPPRKRVTTCQKCIRTPDIERVGKTARHGTYFEMLGNFSFGDYFKHEATAWAWEFCTKVMEMDVDKLWVTIYEDDDEARDIWVNEVGVDPNHIVRMGKEDNFWEHGSGPCGPCSEIYYDRGPEKGCGRPDCRVGCECDRYVEFWNLVFTQFDNDGNGNYTPLSHPNIDTGMGLERLACISQGVDNLFEVDTVRNIMRHIMKIAGVEYGKDHDSDVSLRVITDHIRSTTFMISDGVMPSNEGRGYVLRRLLRRAARHGKLLGINRPFLSEVSETVIKENASAYPELEEKREFIKKVISVEENNFDKTIDQGLSVLEQMIAEADGRLSGEQAFKLYDTFGFPLDLTRDILEEKGISVDEEGFNALMQRQRERARDARSRSDGEAWAGESGLLDGLPKTEFTGYTSESEEAVVLAILKNGESSDYVAQGETAVIILDRTPMYAESGGQTGDIGSITAGESVFKVNDTTKNANGVYMHLGVADSGDVKVGDRVTAAYDRTARNNTRRNHTAAHLLQAALRDTLGTHVEQAGQLVNSRRMRFDFTHFSALTYDELKTVEAKVNGYILDPVAVTTKEMPIEEAKKLGAMALFGEKYGDIVRVVNAEGVSIEFCGGTHVSNTSQIGLFKIISETSVAAGVRRIEAVTGAGVLEYIEKNDALLQNTAKALKVNNVDEVADHAAQLNVQLKEQEKKIEALKRAEAAAQVTDLISGGETINGVLFVAARFDGMQPDTARMISDMIRDRRDDAVAVIAAVNGDKVNFAAAAGKQAIAMGAHAGSIVKAAAAAANGGGGGRPDSAMAGGKDSSKTEEALTAAKRAAESMLLK